MKLKWIFVGLLTAVVVILFVFAYFKFDLSGTLSPADPDGATFVEAGHSYEFDSFMNPLFYSYPNAGGYFCATKDGVKFVGENGEMKMNHMYSMSSPTLAGDGGIIAIAEQRGNMIYVYNSSGLLYEQRMKNPILGFSVNKSGLCSVMTQTENDYTISVYNQNGSLKHEKFVAAKQTVFLAATAVSDDGRVLAELYYDVSGIDISSKITFSYINKGESIDYPDGVFGANDEFSGQIVYVIEFTPDNRLITLSEKELSCIDPESNCQKIAAMAINNKISAFCLTDSGFAIAYGEAVSSDAEAVGIVKAFRLDMSEAATFQSDGKVTYLYGSNGAFVIGNGRDYTAINNNGGGVLWKYNAQKDLKQLIFINGTKKILCVGENKADLLNVSK